MQSFSFRYHFRFHFFGLLCLRNVLIQDPGSDKQESPVWLGHCCSQCVVCVCVGVRWIGTKQFLSHALTSDGASSTTLVQGKR